MKIYTLFITCILFFSFAATAQQQQPTEEENAYIGKWQEFERTYKKKGGGFADFKDTMQLQFMPDSMVRIWYSKGRYFNERYRFNKKELRFGKEYTFDKHWLSEDELILRNKKVFHHFKRVASLKQGAIKKIVPGVERGKVNLNPSFLKGTWSSYKKEDKAFSGKKLYLKTLNVLEQTAEGIYNIKLSLANRMKLERFEGVMDISNSTMKLDLGDETIVYAILKLENNEMILSRDGAIIYLKEFSR